ncbi:16312_t:CDS:1, partial [Gigaspora margarita]
QHFYKDTLPITFLPSNESYSSLYRLYISTIEEQNQNILYLSSFWRIWNKYIPEIKFLSSRSDLCYKCKNIRFNSKYWTEQETKKNINEWNYHILWAQKEREYY